MHSRLLIKKEHSYETRNIDEDIHSCDEWGIMPTELQSQIASEIKDLPENDWKDENGSDEYIPDEVVWKPYEQKIGLVYKGENPSEDIGRFIEFLAYGGYFSLYDERTKIGRQKVRFVKYDPSADFIPLNRESVILFYITVKVNDPITNIQLEL